MRRWFLIDKYPTRYKDYGHKNFGSTIRAFLHNLFCHDKIDYAKMLEWWSQNSYGRNLYIGLGIYRSGTNDAWKDPNQLPNQIKLLRQYPNVQGSIYFSSKSFNKNPNGWCDSLRNNYYSMPAALPEMDWLPRKPGASNAISSQNSDLHVREKQAASTKKPR